MVKRLRGTTPEEKLKLNHTIVDGCWRWLGAHTPSGYGQLAVGGKRRPVHRLAHEFWVGPIGDGLEIDHLCRVRDCINPAHLEAVTRLENVRRQMRAKTHCAQGHEFTPENTRMFLKRGYLCRTCRQCFNADRRAGRAARRIEREREAAKAIRDNLRQYDRERAALADEDVEAVASDG